LLASAEGGLTLRAAKTHQPASLRGLCQAGRGAEGGLAKRDPHPVPRMIGLGMGGGEEGKRNRARVYQMVAPIRIPTRKIAMAEVIP